MRIYNFNDLKESKLIFDRKAPPFGIIITLITLVLVALLLILAGFTTKTYVVKASSMVVSEQKSNLMNSVAGDIKDIYVEEGQEVDIGDTILEIDTFQVELQIEQLEGSILFMQGIIDNTYKLINFIDNYSLDDTNSIKNPFNNNINEEKKFYSSAIQFIDYTTQTTDPDGTPDSGDEVSKTQEEIDDLKTQFTSQHYSTIEQYSYQLITVKSKKKAFEDSLSEYTIKSNINGIMHFSSALTEGTVIQAGSLLGTISSGNSDDLYFETVVSAFDRSKIELNSEVEISLTGVLQSEYGTLKGKVVHIDSDSIQTEEGEVYYKIILKSDETELKDKKGNIVNLTSGMVAESRIKYDETTWLKWAIEQIGVKFR